jgi:hypothetical protein
MLRLAASFLLCALLSGCQNPWKDFYQGNQLPEEAPANGAPECIKTNNFDATIQGCATGSGRTHNLPEPKLALIIRFLVQCTKGTA